MSPAPKLLLAACLALLAMSCSPKHDNAQQQNANSNASPNAGAFENGPGIRVACSDEIQKYCANDPRKRRCLRDNIDKLGSTCKTAVDAPVQANGRRPGVFHICSEDIQKFCANDQRKFRCLKVNLGQLSDACRAAVVAPRDNAGQKGANGHQGELAPDDNP
jgi:hypothetical protein